MADENIPGTRDESFLFASSRVRIFSSAVRGIPCGFSLPPGQRLSRSRFMYDMSLGSLSRPLTFSRILLLVKLVRWLIENRTEV